MLLLHINKTISHGTIAVASIHPLPPSSPSPPNFLCGPLGSTSMTEGSEGCFESVKLIISLAHINGGI
jgi:hypothetical protein